MTQSADLEVIRRGADELILEEDLRAQARARQAPAREGGLRSDGARTCTSATPSCSTRCASSRTWGTT